MAQEDEHVKYLSFTYHKWQPVSMQVEKLDKSYNKMGLKGYKYSSLDVPGAQSCLYHSIIELGDSPFPIISPLG